MRNSSGLPQGSVTWRPIGLGGGGWVVTGPYFANDGTAVAGADVFGAYIMKPGDTRWTCMFDTTRLPAGVNTISYSNMFDPGGGAGCYVLGIAPSDSSRIYLSINYQLLKSTNGGTSFTSIGSPPYELGSNNYSRFCSDRIIIDPQNPNAFTIGAQCSQSVVTASIGTSTGTSATMTVTAAGARNLVVGSRLISAAGIIGGAVVVTALGTGTGGTGTYTVSVPSSYGGMSSETMTFANPAFLIWSTDGGTTVNTIQSNTAWTHPGDNGPTGILVACDPTSSVVGGIKQRWAYAAYGSGIYVSTTGPGGPYSLVSGSPSTPIFLRYDSGGNLWALDDSVLMQCHIDNGTDGVAGTTLTVSNLFSGVIKSGQNVSVNGSGSTLATITGSLTGAGHYGTYTVSASQVLGTSSAPVVVWSDPGNIYRLASAGSTFTAISTNTMQAGEGIKAMAVNPSNTNQVSVFTEDGWAMSSTNLGTTWIGPWKGGGNFKNVTAAPGAIYWRTNGKTSYFGPTKGCFSYDPSGNLWRGEGSGAYVSASIPATVSTTNPWVWQNMTGGMELMGTYHMCAPPGGPAVLANSDFGFFRITDEYGFRNANTIPGTAGDSTGWHVDYAPGNPSFLVGLANFFNSTNQAYSNGSSQDGGLNWTTFANDGTHSQYPGGLLALGGSLVPVSTTEFYWFPSNNFLPAVTTNGGNSFSFLDLSATDINTKPYATLGSGNAALNFLGRTAWDASGNQTYAVTVNAPSGTGSLVDNAGAKTVTVTPPSTSTTATQVAAYITANSTLITATAGGTGGSASATGTATLTFESGFGFTEWSPQHKTVCCDKVTGDLYFYCYMSSNEAGAFYRKPYGGTIVRIGNTPAGAFSSGSGVLKCVPGVAGDLFYKGNSSTLLWRTTVVSNVATWTSVSNVTLCSTMGFGKAAPGKSYPAIYINGTVTAGGDQKGVGGPGIWRSDDNCVSWVYLGTSPGNSTSGANFLEGSPDVYGKVYAPTGAAGCYVGLYNSQFAIS